MKKDFSEPAEVDEQRQPCERRITAFTAEQKEYGFRITIAGCVKLRPAVNLPEYVIGTIDLADQLVPVIDTKAKSGLEPITINEQSCIVLFEHKIGQTKIITGRLFESACEVFDLIVDVMDIPDRHEKLYSCPEDTIVLHEPAQ